jgi:hypothetical protein
MAPLDLRPRNVLDFDRMVTRPTLRAKEERMMTFALKNSRITRKQERAALLACSLVALLAAGCGDGGDTGVTGSDVGTTTDTSQGDTGNIKDTATTTDTVTGTDADTSADTSKDTAVVDDTTVTDTDQGDTTGTDEDVIDDTTVIEDTTVPEDTSTTCVPGEAYCDCKQNSDCDSGYCIEGGSGKICAETCIDSCKQTGFLCSTVTFPGSSDPVSICVPKAGKLCNPCKASADCGSLADGKASCVDSGDAGAFCGSTCTTDNGCEVGYSCKDVKTIEGKDVKQCVPKDNAICQCSDGAIAQELSTVCYTGSGDSKCIGARTCLAAGKQGAPAGGGLSACLAPAPKIEACNAIDDDCDGQTDEATCEDENPCTEGTCDGANGCKTANKAGSCDADGSSCTKDDACKDGKCVVGTTVVCDDNNACTKDSCDKVKGCVYENDDGKGCNADDNSCTQNDQCKAGKCEPGETKACSSEDQCITGKCNIVDGACKYSFEEGQTCNDANPCTVGEKCVTDACKGKATDCDDLNVCTSDACDKVKGCIHNNVPGPCNDGDECTEVDSCDLGGCKGKIVDADVKCTDNNACTTDTCDKTKGCLNVPSATGTKCDDGNTCTVGDSCDAGVCNSGTNTCKCTNDAQCEDDGNLCNGTLYCDKTVPGAYVCKVNPATVKVCDTSKDTFCAATKCVPVSGACEVVKKVDGSSCDADQSLCTKDDQCQSGVCTPGAKLSCDDKNPCTDDVCDPTEGCKFIANTAPCDADGNACTESDICSDKICTAGKKKVCDDKEICTEDSCDPADGSCKTKSLAAVCDDGNACTEGDKCGDKAGVWTCLSGVGPDCDDKNPCTKDSCDKTNGCTNKSDDAATVACYSADPKTQDKGICKAGTKACVGGKLQDTCIGEVPPLSEETCGNGKDDTCNGQTDEGCKPTSYEARFGAAVVGGKVKSGNTEYEARMLVGGSAVAGESKGTKNTANFGFYAWVMSLLSKK